MNIDKQISIKCGGEIYLDWKELKPFQGKLKSITEEKFNDLKESLKKNGLPKGFDIWIDKKNVKWVHDGHHRLLAFKALEDEGWFIPPIPCNKIHANNKKEAAKFLLISNSTYAHMTQESLGDFMIENELSIPDLEFLDLPDLDMNDFNLEESDITEGNCDADEIPENVPTKAKFGDLFILGNHRLICGDSTNISNINRLMNGQEPDMVFSDPPYGMFLDTDYSKMTSKKSFHSGKNHKSVIGDHKDFKVDFITSLLSFQCDEIFLWGADYYAEHLPNKNNGSWIVWDKRIDESADKMYGSTFELCWSKAKHKRDIARVKWAGFFGMSQEDIKTRCHPTQKPVQLIIWFFDKWGNPNDNVADLFGGSGSTLIACEKSNRKCFMSEIDPHYVDVIIERWQKFSGKKAYIINSDGSKTLYDDIV